MLLFLLIIILSSLLLSLLYDGWMILFDECFMFIKLFYFQLHIYIFYRKCGLYDFTSFLITFSFSWWRQCGFYFIDYFILYIYYVIKKRSAPSRPRRWSSGRTRWTSCGLKAPESSVNLNTTRHVYFDLRLFHRWAVKCLKWSFNHPLITSEPGRAEPSRAEPVLMKHAEKKMKNRIKIHWSPVNTKQSQYKKAETLNLN